jgi:transposase-like protein
MVKSATARVHRRHSNAKVDPVIAVTLYQKGKSLRVIARELGVSRMAVARAIHYANISSAPKEPAIPS